jgi:hypothetical protein
MTSRRERKAGADARKSSQFKKAASVAGVEIHTGKSALKAEYRAAVLVASPWTHTESVDLDAHFERSEPNACRWDYGVGVAHGDAELIVWIEPHPASSTGEVKRLVEKLSWLKGKLESPAFAQLKRLTDATVNAGCSPYRWLHAGSLQIARGSKEARTLARAGIDFPVRRLMLPF